MNKLACVLFYIVIDVLLLLFAQDADVRGSKALDIDVLGTARVLSANAKDGSHFGRCEGKAVLDDDYCDCPDSGLDEKKTSACSYYFGMEAANKVIASQRKPSSGRRLSDKVQRAVATTEEDLGRQFHCVGSSVFNSTVPLSRVGDGVCDCCDGSDEYDSPWRPNCTNTCQTGLERLRQGLVEAYMRTQRGLESKARLVDKVNRTRLRARQNLENLESEEKELKDLEKVINSWKYREEKKEFWMQLRLLRRFESACASGVLEACHIQDRGVEAEYSVFRDLVHGSFESYDGYEDAHRAAKTFRDSDERKRRLKEHHQSAGQTLVGVARVRAAECPKYSLEIISEERVPRVHHTLGEYLDYTTSPAGAASRRLTVQQTRRDTTLFGPFLETGEYGQTLALQVASEALGLFIMLPISLPLYLLTRSSEIALNSVWVFAEECATTNPFMTLVTVKKWTGISVVDNIFSEMEHYLLSGFRRLCAMEHIKLGSQLILDTAVEGTAAFEVVSFLDYNRYSLIMDTLQIVEHQTKSFQWMFGIAYRAPVTFFTFFSTPISNSLIPVHRDACTLRAAAETVRAEKLAIAERIRAARDLVSSSFNAKGRDKSSAYGDLEALSDVCVKLVKNQTNNLAHNYEVCFFGEVKQDRTSIGKFSHWERVDGNCNTSLVTRISANPTFPSIMRATNEMAGITRLVYTDGQRCTSTKKNRMATISLQCGEQTNIISVAEPETCVYDFLVETPVACSSDVERPIMTALEQAGVFGFEKRTTASAASDGVRPSGQGNLAQKTKKP